jgi:DNA mismatch repair protein MutS2
MIEETQRVLEYDKVRQLLAGFTVTAPGRARALSLQPHLTAGEVEASLTAISEMVALTAEKGSPPIGGCCDLRGALRQLRAEGSWLLPEVLLGVLASVETADACRRYFLGCERSPQLTGVAAGLVSLRELGRSLQASIGARGEILDSASFELGDLRHGIQQLRGRIKRMLENLLASDALAGVFQDRLITERGGRYVVPVRADHRGQLKGFVHDESASGQTLFLEPTSVLERNNELQTLQREEKREEERILRRLSAAVRQQADALLVNQEILARLDFIAAAARFSLAVDGTAPRLAAEPVVELKAARHPLLLFHADGVPRREGAIPVDLHLGAGTDTLVVSGPNTGGKTVALKTAGLLVLMVRAGLHVPCRSDSKVHLFGKIFADIGDEQSIEANLSTFSGHLVRIRRILEAADGDSLVLLDEIGTGTDPAEGGALALAVLDSLRGRGARTVATTHLNLIKSYAHLRGGVENAAVEFDAQTLAPTYRLHYGIPGASSAFTIARRLGLPEDVLAAAGRYLGEGEREGLELLEELNQLRRQLDQELRAAETLRQRASEEREKRKRLLVELEEQQRGILEKATRRGEQLVRDAERQVKSLLRQAREIASSPPAEARIAGEMRAVREAIAAARPQSKRIGEVPREVTPGEILRVTSLGAEATVVRMQGEEVELDLRGKKLRLPLAVLEQYSPRRFAQRRAGRSVITGRVERERFESRLLLVGKRVDEVLPLLDRFLDDALLHGLREVEVVHGAGEGILRRTVRDFLAGHREVVAFHAGDIARGGDNVTVVELRGS